MAAGFLPLSQLLARGRPAEHVVCRDEGRDITWREFSARTGALARAVADASQRRWLLHCEHPLDFIAALLAVLHAGARAVVPPSFQPGVIEQLRPAYDAIIGESPQATLQPSRVAPASHTFAALDAGKSWMDLYTSGSGGDPKRVEKSLAQLETEARALESAWGAALGGATVIATVPHHHIYGMLFRLIWPLAAGRPFDAVTCTHPPALLERLARSGDAIVVSSPAHLARLPELIELEALRPAARCIYSSGGPLPAAAAQEFARRLGAAPTEVYGSTETGGIAWRRQDRGGAAWTPFPGMDIAVDAEQALRLRSPYLPQREWVTLDDAAELAADGRFVLKGRLDRVVKLEGKRLSLPEMEERLRRHPWVLDAGIVPLAGRKETLGAAVVLQAAARQRLQDEGRPRIADELRQFLGSWFEPVLLPRHWRFPERLPLGDRGKPTTAALAALFHGDPDARLLPDIVAERRDANRVELDLHVPPDLAHFAGHFPGCPILPGVVQMDWAVRLAAPRLRWRGNFSGAENLRFHSLILPDARITLTLTLDATGKRLGFAYASLEKKHSSGTLVFAAP